MKRLALAAIATLLAAQPAQAQSILRDAETEAMFADMSVPLVKAAGLSPRDVRVVLKDVVEAMRYGFACKDRRILRQRHIHEQFRPV